jgi:hypothetical protein
MPIDPRAGEISALRLFPGYDIASIPDRSAARVNTWIDMNFATVNGETVKIGANTYHIIDTTASGNFKINRPVGNATIQVLAVGGGGYGRTAYGGRSSGAGAGGVANFSNVSVAKGSYTITIGAGATGGGGGSNTTFADSSATNLVNARGGGGPGGQGGCGGGEGGQGFQGGQGGNGAFGGSGGGICGEGSSHGTWNCQTWASYSGGGGVSGNGGGPNANDRGGNAGSGAEITSYDANLTAANFTKLATGSPNGGTVTHFSTGDPGGGGHEHSPGANNQFNAGNHASGNTAAKGNGRNSQNQTGNGVVIIRYVG